MDKIRHCFRRSHQGAVKKYFVFSRAILAVFLLRRVIVQYLCTCLRWILASLVTIATVLPLVNCRVFRIRIYIDRPQPHGSCFQDRSWGLVTLCLCHLNLIKLFIMISQVATGILVLIIMVQSLIIADRIQNSFRNNDFPLNTPSILIGP